MAQVKPLEIHFTDGFSGEAVSLSVNGEEVDKFQAKTKLQVGLARVVHLEAKSGDVIVIELLDLNFSQSITLDEVPRYVIIRMNDGVLTTEQTDDQQRYL